MIILELLVLMVAIILCFIVIIMSYLGIALIVFCLATPFIVAYELKLPNLKMRDEEIPIEQVTFEPRNLLKEQYEKQS